MPSIHDNTGSELDESTGIQSIRTGGSGANLSTTSGYWNQAAPGAPVVPVSEFALGDLPDGSSNSVLGRAANSSGVLAGIASSGIGDTLRNRNGTLTWARNVFSVYDFGATGDGVTDDYAAIANTITAALASGHSSPLIYFPPAIGYASTLAIAITLAASGPLSVIMDAKLLYTGSAQTGAFFTIGLIGSVKNVQGTQFRLWVERSTQSDWSDDTHAGLRLLNFNNTNIEIVRADNFTTGVQCVGVGDGFAYNEIHIGRIGQNRYGIDFTHDDTGGVNGWCNGNRLYGGRFFYNETGGASDSIHRYAARFRIQDTRTGSPNNFTWHNPIVEIGKASDSYVTGHPFLVERGNSIRIFDAAIEGANEPAIFLGNPTTPTDDPYANTIELGYTQSITNAKDDRSSIASNLVIEAQRSFAREANKLVFAADDMLSRATPHNGTVISLHGVGALISTPTLSRTVSVGANDLDYGSDHLSVGSNAVLGAKLSTGSTKQFYLALNQAGGASRFVVQAYDSSGNVITSSANWIANTAYALLARVQPTSGNVNGLWYRCTTNGTSHATTEPTWPTTVGATVSDGSVVWTCEGPAPVRGNRSGSWAYNSGFGGVWRTVSGNTEAFISVNDQVASIFVGASAGSSNCQLRGLKIYGTTPPTGGSTPYVSLGYSGSQNWNRRLAVQSPQTSAFGTFSVSDTVWNSAAAVGSPIGWICTVAGTPGTWVAMANL